MKNRFSQLLKLTRKAKQQSMGMQRKLLMYWVSMLLVIFAAFLVILSVTGVFFDSEKEMQQMLCTQQKNMVTDLTAQINRLTAQGIALSEHASNVLSERLFAEPVSSLNNDAQRINEMESILYGYLKTALQSSPCNGVWLLLDATINTSAQNAQNSRAGLYIRFANLNDKNAVDQDMTLYRGLPDIARQDQVELHNRWQLEFDLSHIPSADRLMQQPAVRLADCCVWTGRIRLPNTWEDVTQLIVPIQANDGSVCGLCGIELSDLYFRLSYPPNQSDFGSMVTVLAPVRDGELILSQGMTGGTEGTYLYNEDFLIIKEGEFFNTYVGKEHTFLGVHTMTEMRMADGSQMAAVTLAPQENYMRARNIHRISWGIGATAFFAAMLVLSVWLSRRFVEPIAKSLEVIQAEEPLEQDRSGIAEIDALLAFVRSKAQNPEENSLPPDIKDLLDTFSARARHLTSTERSILKYYAAGKEVSEVAELACISIHTVRRHNANIYQKLEVGSREELMLYIELFTRCGRINELLEP